MGRRDRKRQVQRRHDDSIRETRRGWKVGLLGVAITALVATAPIVAGRVGPEDGRDEQMPSARIVAQTDSPNNAVVPVGVRDLPVPPTYRPDGPDRQESHCVEWEEWLDQQGAASTPTRR